MRVFITGATGVLGRRLVRLLAARGDAVRGVVRSDEGEALVRRLGGEPVRAGLFDAGALARAAEGAEVVVHAATAIPTAPRTRPADWALNDRIRREGTEALLRAAADAGARLYLQQSVVWVAGRDGKPFDEDTPPAPGILVRSALDGERIAQELGAARGLPVGVLRCGVFYAADAGHTIGMAAALRRRQLPIIGPGDNLLAPIHADDAAGAFVTAALRGRAGLWHVVDDEPVTLARLLREFAERLGAPPPRRVPRWLARLLAGPLAVETVSTSMNTSNARFKRETGWQPAYPTYREGLASVVREWQEAPAARV